MEFWEAKSVRFLWPNTLEKLDEGMMEKARMGVNSLIKPPNSLGILEELAIQLAGITGEMYPMK